MFIRSPDNRTWLNFDPKRSSLRDGGNLNWLEIDCKPDPLFDEPCAFKDIASVNCPSGVETWQLGSGDGVGSDGEQFDLIKGYPAGYDLPDAGESGFYLERDIGSPKGFGIKRPALNYALESYDRGGTTSNLGRGTYDNPNYLWATTFSSGCTITEVIYDLGQTAGWYEVPFASYHPDGVSVDVYYLGRRIATTCGRIKDRYKIEFYFDPAAGSGESRVMIRVRGADATRWSLMVIGPKQNLNVYALDWNDPAHAIAIRQDEYNGTPIFPAPCHATVFPRTYKTNDGKWFYEFHHYVGENADPTEIARMVLDYTSWMNMDKFEVYHGGLRVGSTMDPQQLQGMISFLWEPNRFAFPVPDLMIRVSAEVRSLDEDIMSWYYTLYCQNTIGYRASPWPCETPVAGLNSMGHSSTEDNYNMDTGIEASVVSIKVVPYGNFEYTVSVFDIDQNLIAFTTANKTSFTQFFILKDQHGDTRDRIAVRVDAPLGASWVCYVGCPVAILDIEIDDKTIPVCDSDLEITVQDLGIPKNSTGKFLISTNIPVRNEVTIDVATADGTALSALGAGDYAGLPSIYGIMNDVDSPIENSTVATRTGRFMVQNWSDSSVIFDNGWGNLANPEFKNDSQSVMGNNTNQYQNIETSTFVNLSADARLVVNAWKHKLGDLTGKRWIILTDSRDPAGDFGVVCSNFVQSMINIYGLHVHIVRDDYSTQNFSSYDIITIANSRTWGENGMFSAAGVHYMARVFQGFKSPVGIAIATQVKTNKVLHCYFRATNQRLAQNILIRDVMNCFNDVKFVWDEYQIKIQSIPSVSLDRHLAAYPDTPLLNGITEPKLDTDFTVLDMNFVIPENRDPDYESKTGTVVIPVGSSSATFEVRTLDPAISPIGKFFYLDLLAASEGTVVDNQGKATIVNSNAPNPVTDLHFSKTFFEATSWSYVSGCTITIGVDLTTIGAGGTDQAGTIAAMEADTNPYDNSPTNTRRYSNIGSYQKDANLTYEYRWETFVRTVGTVTHPTITPLPDYGPLENIRYLVVSLSNTESAYMDESVVVEAYLYVKDSNGRVLRSNMITLRLNYIIPANGGGDNDGPSGIIF